MAGVPSLLLDILYDLVKEELKKFHFYLSNEVPEGFSCIPRGLVNELDRPDTVQLLVQTYGHDGAVTVTADILARLPNLPLADKLRKEYKEVSGDKRGQETNLCAIQSNLKSSLRLKCQSVYEGNSDEGETVYLNKIYTELHVIEGAWGGMGEELEVRQQIFNHITTDETAIKARDLFKPKPDQEKRIRTVLTQGIPGMGKTVCAQKFALSWAEGTENQDISFLFLLPFRELNPNINEKDRSLMQLLHQFFPEIKPLEKLGSGGTVLFIFDGLDETLLPLEFKRNKVLRDETEPAPLDVLITNLITGDLLATSLVWITSRPAAADKIPRKHIHRWTELRGFASEQREEYFKKRLRDENLAVRVINHVKSSRSLYIMCQIPVFCQITVTVMRRMLQGGVGGSMPNTLTEMYAYLLLCQTDRMVEGDYPTEGKDIVLKLAELAFRQLEKGNLIFYECDLKECGMNVNDATVYSGVCTELFMMEGRKTREVFSFVHLTIQEFLAAVYAHHSYMQKKDNVLLSYLKRVSSKLLPRSMFGFHKTAIERALENQDGRWDLFLRFLLGLSLKSNQDLLGRILHLTSNNEEDLARTIQFIKEKIKEEPETKLNLFHCLSELKEESLVQEVQTFVSSGNLATKKLSPVQWSALTFELMTTEATGEEFDLKKYMRSEEGVVKLLTVITSSSRALLNRCNLTDNCCEVLSSALSSTSSHLCELDLSNNNLRDSGVKLLSVGLKSPHCKLKSLRLHKCNLDGDCCEALAVAFSTDSTQLKELDLSANDIQDAGLKALCVGLRSHNCKLETMRLNHCKLGETSCADLALVFSSGASQMKTLDVSSNSLRDSGVSLLRDGLGSPHCRLERLRLSLCGLTQKCFSPIASALGSEHTRLTDLDLSGNNLQHQDLHLLCAALGGPHCKLETLRLSECNLQRCCANLASVLCSDESSLKELDLSGNDLQDSEVQLLSAGLARAECKLENLRLSFCSITDQGSSCLVEALSSNPSHLRKLDLSYNHLQESGLRLLTDLYNSPACKLEQLCVDNNAECFLKAKLKNYACELRLDGDTASRSLFLHEDGQRVTWVREQQRYPDHPDRFESVSQVLCQPGLTGRHYWEVEWRGQWVDVAVATRGLSRRAGSHLCGFGYTEQSWSLFCSEDHYTAQHDRRSQEIPAPPSGSRRVAVFLDRPGGTLSFYSVSPGSLSHLHTFHSTFTGPLYAGFGMEKDDCSVTICKVERPQEPLTHNQRQ